MFALPFALVGVCFASAVVTPSRGAWWAGCWWRSRRRASPAWASTASSTATSTRSTRARRCARFRAGRSRCRRPRWRSPRSCVLFVIAAWQLNPLCLWLSPVALALGAGLQLHQALHALVAPVARARAGHRAGGRLPRRDRRVERAVVAAVRAVAGRDDVDRRLRHPLRAAGRRVRPPAGAALDPRGHRRAGGHQRGACAARDHGALSGGRGGRGSTGARRHRRGRGDLAHARRRGAGGRAARVGAPPGAPRRPQQARRGVLHHERHHLHALLRVRAGRHAARAGVEAHDHSLGHPVVLAITGAIGCAVRGAPARGAGHAAGADLADRLVARLAAAADGDRHRRPRCAARVCGPRCVRRARARVRRRRSWRAAGVRIGAHERHGDLSVLHGHGERHRAWYVPFAGGARGRRDAQGAAPAAARAAGDAAVARAPGEHAPP